MRFRPCIDIHNGKVKQIVGGTLREGGAGVPISGGMHSGTVDGGEGPVENFVSEKDAAWFASFYKEKGLTGGHVILLNAAGTPEYEVTKAQALAALSAWPGGMMVGGGITPENAEEFLRAGASHVIVTSYLFPKGTNEPSPDGEHDGGSSGPEAAFAETPGKLDRARLAEMVAAVGADRLVIDLSCRRADAARETAQGKNARPVYRVATDRWQTLTAEIVTPELFEELGCSCADFLIHAVDVEGTASGVEEELLPILAEGALKSGRPITYAGGIRDKEDIRRIRDEGKGRIDFTVGSALDLFGGALPFDVVVIDA